MRINADFARRAISLSQTASWSASPSAGVERRMLDRIGDEIARATTIVRFAPGSSFPMHIHGGGEEYYVLEGDFVDENGSHKAGTYVRNPPGSRHCPSSPDGATIFVKLNQFDPNDRAPVVIDTNRLTNRTGNTNSAVEMLRLHSYAKEDVRVEAWRADIEFDKRGHGGLEILVLEGEFIESGIRFTRHSWLRLPPSESFVARAGPAGVRMLVKSGHLAEIGAGSAD